MVTWCIASLNLQYDARSVDCLMTVVGVETEWLYFPLSALTASNPHCVSRTQMIILLSALTASNSTLKVTGIKGENDGGITSCTYSQRIHFFKTEECCTLT